MADLMFKSTIGWRTTYIVLGVALAVVLTLAGIILKRPSIETVTALSDKTKAASSVASKQEFTSVQMICRLSFWMAFICISLLAAVGSSVISFAKDLALSVEAPEALAVSLVGRYRMQKNYDIS